MYTKTDQALHKIGVQEAEPIKVKVPLYGGDGIITKQIVAYIIYAKTTTGWAELQLYENSEAQIIPNGLRNFKGRGWVRVKGVFIVNTHGIKGELRGTEFFIESRRGVTVITIIDGSMEVTQEGFPLAVVSEGEEGTFSPLAPPEIRPADPEVLEDARRHAARINKIVARRPPNVTTTSILNLPPARGRDNPTKESTSEQAGASVRITITSDIPF